MSSRDETNVLLLCLARHRRRGFVSTLLDRGVSLSTVASMAGHADVSTTARYDRRGERAKKEASKMLVLTAPTQN